MWKFILVFVVIVLSFLSFGLGPASATNLWFEPATQVYAPGDTIEIDLYADIDQTDAIFGFGFDLSFDNGTSYISGPGDGGTYLTFLGFTPNSTYFQYDPMFPPLWDDGDTIAGEVPFGNPDVWGTNILLGTFAFAAPTSGAIGLENIYLGPPEGDYGIFGEEGLLGTIALMPNNPTASAAPVPEPTTFLLVTTGLGGLFGFRKKFRKK